MPGITRTRRVLLIHALLCAKWSGCAVLAPWPRKSGPGPAPDNHQEDELEMAVDPESLTAQLVAHHNRIRSEARLPSLSPSRRLQEAAEDHVRDMAARHAMSHKGSDGSTTTSRILAKGYRMRRCGENVAFGPRTVEAVIKGWMNSPPHKGNILGNFSQIGAALATARDGTAFWCVTFGLPARPK
jgi:uncharacterized protein YkwD